MQKFYHKDCPDSVTFIEYVKSHCPDFLEKCNTLSPLDPIHNICNIKNHSLILDDVHTLYDEIGPIPWKSQYYKNLTGLSLSYNPDTNEDEWATHSFGHLRYRKFLNGSYFEQPSKERQYAVKNDYLDSYGYRRLLLQLKSLTHLSAFLNSFNLSVIRVTARTINNSQATELNSSLGYHTDDNPFEMVRVNLCLDNDGHYGLQYINSEPSFPKCGDLELIHTNTLHRVFVKPNALKQRTHLIIGLSPWFKYNEVEDCWEKNEYYGNTHPFDIVKNNLFRKNI